MPWNYNNKQLAKPLKWSSKFKKFKYDHDEGNIFFKQFTMLGDSKHEDSASQLIQYV